MFLSYTSLYLYNAAGQATVAASPRKRPTALRNHSDPKNVSPCRQFRQKQTFYRSDSTGNMVQGTNTFSIDLLVVRY